MDPQSTSRSPRGPPEVTGDFYAWQTQLKISDPSDDQRQNFQAMGARWRFMGESWLTRCFTRIAMYDLLAMYITSLVGMFKQNEDTANWMVWY
jgi:hypothetical protein